MPPNKKGGKGYRKGKHSGEFEAEMLQWDEQGGQMPGRVMKKLGDRRFRVFCNDNKERICKLCGSMRKSDWVEEGAIVILGTRALGNVVQENNKEKDKDLLLGDILAVVDTTLYGKFKKMPTVNKLLFITVESQDMNSILKKVGTAKESDDDDIFDRSGENGKENENEKEEDVEDSEEEGEPMTEQEKMAKRKEKEKKREAEFTARRDAKAGGFDEVNIDEI